MTATADGGIVIVGGGPAASSCAKSYREHGGREPVTILGDEPDPPYRRPPLTKELLRGEAERGELPLEEPGFYERHGIELRTGVEVTAIDAGSRTVTTAAGETTRFGACVIASGSRPAHPDVPGMDLPAVRTVRCIADSEQLREDAGDGIRALVIGSGFIGCEAAISLTHRGAAVVLATMEPLPQEERLGDEVATRIVGWLEQAGVELITDLELGSIEPDGDGVIAHLGERTAAADVVVAALGIDRNTELAAEAGIELEGDCIPTDERMRTRAEGILAAGDVAMAYNPAAGRRLSVEHWGEALRHGEVAGAVLAGDQDECWSNAPGFWSGLGGRTIKEVGWGDGFDRVELTDHGSEAFTARYVRDGEFVAVLTHEADGEYERGRELVEARARWT